MIENSYKDVNFKHYCAECKYSELKEFEDPCNDCLENGVRNGTEKPLYFEKKE